MDTTNLVAVSALRELAQAGALSDIRLVAQQDSFILCVRVGLQERILQAKRGHVRQFKSLNRAVNFLRELGCSTITVDLSKWHPSQRSF